MILETKQFFCPKCNYTQVLGMNESGPSTCPKCGSGTTYTNTPVSKEDKLRTENTNEYQKWPKLNS